MSASASHANAATTELLDLPAQQRIRAIRSERWVSYPRVQKAIQILDQILDHPRTTRMPSIAIFGDSGMGKTMLMQKFCADHPPGVDAETEQHRMPVLALQMTSRPGERRFYAQILDALGAPHNPGARIVDAERSALNLLRAAQIQILVIDEVHNILSGSYREQRTMLNMLRFISNDLKASLVCFGVMEAREAIQGDVQLARRFDVLTMPRYVAAAVAAPPSHAPRDTRPARVAAALDRHDHPRIRRHRRRSRVEYGDWVLPMFIRVRILAGLVAAMKNPLEQLSRLRQSRAFGPQFDRVLAQDPIVTPNTPPQSHLT